jgi:hypothetical protein
LDSINQVCDFFHIVVPCVCVCTFGRAPLVTYIPTFRCLLSHLYTFGCPFGRRLWSHIDTFVLTFGLNIPHPHPRNTSGGGAPLPPTHSGELWCTLLTWRPDGLGESPTPSDVHMACMGSLICFLLYIFFSFPPYGAIGLHLVTYIPHMLHLCEHVPPRMVQLAAI